MTRIYQLDTIDQEDIDSTHIFPAEDSAGDETVKMSISQLGRYLFCKAGTEGEGGLFEGHNIAIGNQSFAGSTDGEGGVSTYSTAVGPYSNAGGEGGENNSYCSAFGYQNRASANNSASAFGFQNYATDNNASAFGYQNNASDVNASAFGNNNNASDEATTAVGYNNSASGYGATSVGYNNDADQSGSTAVGYNNDAEGIGATAVGYNNNAESNQSTAMGFECNAYAERSTALGYRGLTRWADTVNVGGTIVVRAHSGEEINSSMNFAQFSGVQNVVLTPSIDFTTTTSVLLTVPDSCTFYVDEISIITDANTTGVTGQPTVKFGWTENDDGFVADVATTNLLTLGSREIYTSLLTNDGVHSLLATVTVAGSATTLHGRIMWKGVLVEDTPLPG